MQQVVIENPILNSPFKEPTRHFRFSDEGITNDIVEARRVSSYFVDSTDFKSYGDKEKRFHLTSNAQIYQATSDKKH